MSRRVRLTLDQLRWFDQVYQHIKRYKCKGSSLIQAFSDVHDGNLFIGEVRSLVRKRLLSWNPRKTPSSEMEFNLMGNATRITVDMAPRTIKLLTLREDKN